ncbi:hypothetical protein MCL91_05005, partial [Providencia rettgeri]|uniref:hypothetical protein n=2 Tax=Morganellaceae TaxID=1903414 RepID=UPI001EFE96C7
LANSVVKGDSFSGAFALNYLEEVTIENGKNLMRIKLTIYDSIWLMVMSKFYETDSLRKA